MRNQIDLIDSEIIRILRKRMEFSLRLGKLKKILKMRIYEPERERAIIENIKRLSYGAISEEFSLRFFSLILRESRRLQRSKYKLIGFQGEHGAYSEIAANIFDPELKTIPFLKFSEILKAVNEESIDFGIFPVENSISGLVKENDEFILRKEFLVAGEVSLKICHCLLSLPGNKLEDIKFVYSHPHALFQCRIFLERNKIEARPFYDTGGAGMMLERERINGAGVIASKKCSELYHLVVLKEDIQDQTENYTRFLIITKKK